MRPGIVPEFHDAGMLVKGSLDDAALHAAAAAVDQPYFAQAGGSSGVDKLLHDRRDVSWGERVEIQLALDRDADRVISHRNRTTVRRFESRRAAPPGRRRSAGALREGGSRTLCTLGTLAHGPDP